MLKSTFFAAVLALAPGLAFAQGCDRDSHQKTTAMSCAEGSVINTETGLCEPIITG